GIEAHRWTRDPLRHRRRESGQLLGAEYPMARDHQPHARLARERRGNVGEVIVRTGASGVPVGLRRDLRVGSPWELRRREQAYSGIAATHRSTYFLLEFVE